MTRFLAIFAAHVAVIAVATAALAARWQLPAVDAGMIVLFLFGCAAIFVIPFLLSRK